MGWSGLIGMRWHIEQSHIFQTNANGVIEKATLIAENAWGYGEKLAALNTITKAIQAAAKITGLESSPSSVTNNTLIANEQELLKSLANYHQSKNGKSVTEVQISSPESRSAEPREFVRSDAGAT